MSMFIVIIGIKYNSRTGKTVFLEEKNQFNTKVEDGSYAYERLDVCSFSIQICFFLGLSKIVQNNLSNKTKKNLSVITHV